MSRNIILGSGIVGLIAAEIFRDAIVIPYGHSRYYYYYPFLEDNTILRTDVSSEFIDSIVPNDYPIYHKSAINFSGQFIWHPVPLATKEYLNKIHQGLDHPHAEKLLKLEYFVHRLTVKDLYTTLIRRHYSRIKSDLDEFGHYVKQFNDDNTITTDKARVSYDNIISTIPLDALTGVLGMEFDLPARDVYYTHVKSPDVALEGADTAYVSDYNIEFFKVLKVDRINYIFQSFRPLNEEYFNLFCKSLEIPNKTGIKNALPQGEPPDLAQLEKNNLYCVGSNAQWDYWMCVSSCINRLYKLYKELS